VVVPFVGQQFVLMDNLLIEELQPLFRHVWIPISVPETNWANVAAGISCESGS
jgi:hypothetical protein